MPLTPELTPDCRPAPKDPAVAERVFVTMRGNFWVIAERINRDGGKIRSVTHMDHVAQEFRRLFGKAGIDRPRGCGFSWLRHTFYTVARRTKDYDAVSAIAGHAAGGMVEHYLEDVNLIELKAVTDHVRAWLFDG